MQPAIPRDSAETLKLGGTGKRRSNVRRGTSADERIGMFTTTSPDGTLTSRPMALQQVEFDGDLWFFASRSSRKVAHLTTDPQVKNLLGFAQTPGVTEYYDWMNKTWVTMPEGEIHQTPTHAYNGWSYYITSQSQNPEAAWAWIKFHGSPGISAIDVASPDSGFQPWRKSHETNLELWLDAGWDEAEAQAYISTILAATDHPNADARKTQKRRRVQRVRRSRSSCR